MDMPEDTVRELASSPLEIRYLRDYGETSRVILDSILEHNSNVTSKLDTALSEIEEARSHMEKLKADMEKFRAECNTARRGYESLRQKHDELMKQLMVLKEDMARWREEAKRVESEVKVKHCRQLRLKAGDDLDQLLARLCKINKHILSKERLDSVL